MRDTTKHLCLVFCALTFVAFGIGRVAADGTFPGLLQPGQVLGNGGTSAAPAGPISVWAAAPPAGGTNLFASPTGSDTNNNCTAPGSPCTLKGACAVRSQIATFLSGSFAINLANGTYSTTDGNGALCTIEGNNGGSALALTSLVGNSGSPTSVILAAPNSSIGVLSQDLGEVSISGVEFTGGTNATGIQCRQFAVCDYGNVVWGTFGSGGIHVNGVTGSSTNLVTGETLNANIAFHWLFTGNAIFNSSVATSIPSAIAISGAFLDATGDVNLNLSSASFTGGGVAGTTGTRAILTGPGYLITNAATPCVSFFPGGGGCSLTLGFQDNAGDGIIQPAQGGTGYTAAPARSTFKSISAGGLGSISSTSYEQLGVKVRLRQQRPAMF